MMRQKDNRNCGFSCESKQVLRHLLLPLIHTLTHTQDKQTFSQLSHTRLLHEAQRFLPPASLLPIHTVQLSCSSHEKHLLNKLNIEKGKKDGSKERLVARVAGAGPAAAHTIIRITRQTEERLQFVVRPLSFRPRSEVSSIRPPPR